MNEEINEEINEIILEVETRTEVSENLTAYEIAQRTYTIVSVLTFIVIVIFLYKYLKNCLRLRK